MFYGAPTKSKLLSTLCSGDVCQCAEGEARAWGGRGGACWAYRLTWALALGKCPRQRRALERGLVDEDGYRMKFACYYPRVDYGQCPRWPCPALPSGLGPRLLRAGLRAAPAAHPLLAVLPNRSPGFQVKVLREDSRAAFRLFETSIRRVLHFCTSGRRAGGLGRRALGSGLLPVESSACWEGPVDAVCKAPAPGWPCPSVSPLTALVPISLQPRTPRPLLVRPETFWFELLAAFSWNLGKNT